MSDLKHLQLTEEQRSIAEGFIAIAKDLQSYKAAIARLAENQEAEHAKMLEMAKLLETIQEVWTNHRRARRAAQRADQTPGGLTSAGAAQGSAGQLKVTLLRAARGEKLKACPRFRVSRSPHTRKASRICSTAWTRRLWHSSKAPIPKLNRSVHGAR